MLWSGWVEKPNADQVRLQCTRDLLVYGDGQIRSLACLMQAPQSLRCRLHVSLNRLDSYRVQLFVWDFCNR